MRSNPLVCLQVDERTSNDHWMSIIVSGRYQELPETPELAPDLAQAQQALQHHAAWWAYTSIPSAEWRRKEGPFTPIFYRIHIDTLTGHRATPRASS
jgi:nitroimidazol reductase NimA-like FMN-containing flavoprotein (pyridoxamine 5'-phosphate oxidase superfamily)